MITDYIKLTHDLETYGATLPKPVTAARATLAAAKETAAAQPLADLAAEYQSGKVTAANVGARMTEAGQALAGVDHIRQVLTTIENGVTGTIRAGIRTDAEKILTGLRPAFDEAAAIVQTAGAHFGSTATAEQILAGGVDAVVANQHLTQALNTLTQLRGLRVALCDCGYGADEQDVTWWIAGADDALALDTARRAYTAPGDAFHNLAALGFTLRMNTPQEAERVATGAQNATDAREAAQREEALREHRESWAPSLAYAASLSAGTEQS